MGEQRSQTLSESDNTGGQVAPLSESAMGESDTTGVLLMAYGTPGSPEEVEPYYTHIRRGRPPTAEQLQDLVERYKRVGGVSPLREITFDLARLVEQSLRVKGLKAKVFVGMKHWHPFIAEAVGDMVSAGIAEAVGIVLAPHYSSMSIGRYIADAEEARRQNEVAQTGCLGGTERSDAAEANALRDATPATGRNLPGTSLRIRYVERWGMNVTFLAELAKRVETALAGSDRERTLVLFTAHSLPARLKAEGDPYEAELLETAGALAVRLKLPHWRFAFQSASTTGEPWLGPDILDVLGETKASGAYDGVVVCSVGFLADHLEILYDLDVEAAERCAELGLSFRRTPSLNTSPALVDAVVHEVMGVLREGS
jgi:ferrochelatase